jgi:hypothetical protein
MADKTGKDTITPNMEAAMEAIRNDPKGKELFAADPVAFLKSKGVTTDGLYFSPPTEVSDADLSLVAGGGCVSAGYYVCYSEG